MHPAQRAQVGVVKALHADRQARDAGRAKGLESVLLEGARIRLQRDFAVGRQQQPGAQRTQQLVNRLR